MMFDVDSFQFDKRKWIPVVVGMLFSVSLGCRGKSDESMPKPVPEPITSVTTAPSASAVAKAVAPAPPPVPMVHFDAGKFMIGMPGNAIGGDYSNMQPMHEVKVPAFSLDVNEVTVTEYRACVVAGVCSETGLASDKSKNDTRVCNWGEPGYEGDPINCVTYEQAEQYCKWAGKSLPTEEMWEYAAGGPKKRTFPWGKGVSGNQWGMPDDDYAYVGGGCDHVEREKNPARKWRDEPTCPIGVRPKSDTPEGLKDMATNVSEWMSSPFCPYDKPQCTTKERVVRGGYNGAHPATYLVVARWGADHSARNDKVGFRCAKLEGG